MFSLDALSLLALPRSITRTPGISKTFFGLYLLFKIRESNPEAVIMRMGRDDKVVSHPGPLPLWTGRVGVQRPGLRLKTGWLIDC